MNCFDWMAGLIDAVGRGAASLKAAQPFLLALAILVIAGLGASALRGKRRAGYRRGRFLSANEKAFLRALDRALGDGYRVFAQVRLAELADAEAGSSDGLRKAALRKVFSKSIDFVICETGSIEPVAAIEVDDRISRRIAGNGTPSSTKSSTKSAFPCCGSSPVASIPSRSCARGWRRLVSASRRRFHCRKEPSGEMQLSCRRACHNRGCRRAGRRVRTRPLDRSRLWLGRRPRDRARGFRPQALVKKAACSSKKADGSSIHRPVVPLNANISGSARNAKPSR